MRKVFPYIKTEYFTDHKDQEIFNLIHAYVEKYNSSPSKEALLIDLFNSDLNDEAKEEAEKIVNDLEIDPKTSFDWLVDEAEKWCKDRAIYLALNQAIMICDGKDQKFTKQAIPQILTDALGISFDSHIGHDYFDDAEERFEGYHRIEDRIPFDIEKLNTITDGGVPRKSLSVLMAGVNVGKTMLMCSMAAANLRDSKNVLYITMEMSETMITQRIEANLMDLTMKDVKLLEKDQFLSKVKNIRSKTTGRLKVKEYPTSTASSSHFRYLINELKLKQNFIPDIIYVDYLNICSSARIKMGKSGLYEYVKAVIEEVRGLAVEFNLPIITATQFNREGMKSSDPSLDQVSESLGTGMTADMVLAVIRSDELDKDGQILISQLKNRFSNKNDIPKFTVKVDINKMKLYNEEFAKVDEEEFVDPETGEIFTGDEAKNSGKKLLNSKSFEGWTF